MEQLSMGIQIIDATDPGMIGPSQPIEAAALLQSKKNSHTNELLNKKQQRGRKRSYCFPSEITK